MSIRHIQHTSGPAISRMTGIPEHVVNRAALGAAVLGTAYYNGALDSTNTREARQYDGLGNLAWRPSDYNTHNPGLVAHSRSAQEFTTMAAQHSAMAARDQDYHISKVQESLKGLTRHIKKLDFDTLNYIIEKHRLQDIVINAPIGQMNNVKELLKLCIDFSAEKDKKYVQQVLNKFNEDLKLNQK